MHSSEVTAREMLHVPKKRKVGASGSFESAVTVSLTPRYWRGREGEGKGGTCCIAREGVNALTSIALQSMGGGA